MRSLSWMKVGRGRWMAALACVAALATAVVACNDPGDDGGGNGNGQPDANSPAPETVAIDTGATINSTAGNGVGVFVTYTEGGHWTMSTACDTNTSQLSCGFDLFVSTVDPSATLSDPAGQDLSGPDTVDILSDGSLHLGTDTSTGLDGMTFNATPGASLQLQMYLDGELQPRFVYWIGKGVLHTGAPTDPVNLAPTAP